MQQASAYTIEDLDGQIEDITETCGIDCRAMAGFGGREDHFECRYDLAEQAFRPGRVQKG